jgi:hypothetical protein
MSGGGHVIARVHRIAAGAWTIVATAAGLGFVARDVLGMSAGLVVLAWIAGALAGLSASRGTLTMK